MPLADENVSQTSGISFSLSVFWIQDDKLRTCVQILKEFKFICLKIEVIIGNCTPGSGNSLNADPDPWLATTTFLKSCEFWCWMLTFIYFYRNFYHLTYFRGSITKFVEKWMGISSFNTDIKKGFPFGAGSKNNNFWSGSRSERSYNYRSGSFWIRDTAFWRQCTFCSKQYLSEKMGKTFPYFAQLGPRSKVN